MAKTDTRRSEKEISTWVKELRRDLRSASRRVREAEGGSAVDGEPYEDLAYAKGALDALKWTLRRNV